jgi:DNA-binding NtrC family response regulator
MTAYGDVDEAVASIKEGALDYLTKPFELDEITTRIDRVEARLAGASVGAAAEAGAGASVALVERMRSCELECVLEALRRTGGRKAAAAQLLGISRKSLWKKIRKHGLAAGGAAEQDSAFPK